MIRAAQHDKSVDLCLWVREWIRFHPNAEICNSVMERFAIGIYQIYQGLDWKGTHCAYESWAAATIHFIATAEMFDVGVENHLPSKLSGDVGVRRDDAKLLWHISRAQQYVFYGYLGKKTKRSERRASNEALADALGELVQHTLCRIPPFRRQEAFELAEEVICNAL